MPKICIKNIQKNFRFIFVDKMIFNPKWDKKERPKRLETKFERIEHYSAPVSDLDEVEEKWKRLGF
jgi:hypothetical protein